jgi:hypothetical protein
MHRKEARLTTRRRSCWEANDDAKTRLLQVIVMQTKQAKPGAHARPGIAGHPPDVKWKCLGRGVRFTTLNACPKLPDPRIVDRLNVEVELETESDRRGCWWWAANMHVHAAS